VKLPQFSIATKLYAIFALLAAPRMLTAQVNSGPSADSKIEALKVVAATGDSAGKEADLAAERKEKPAHVSYEPERDTMVGTRERHEGTVHQEFLA
jgi:hypothetical protein